MAAVAHITPELRAYPIFDMLPPGCEAVPVTNHDSYPILRPGDFVVVDTAQRDPEHRELFVVQWTGGQRQIVETYLQAGRYGQGAEMKDGYAWWLGAYRRPRSHEQLVAWLKAGRSGGFVDGPYASEGERSKYLPTKLVGRVVGILEPAFDESSLRSVN